LLLLYPTAFSFSQAKFLSNFAFHLFWKIYALHGIRYMVAHADTVHLHVVVEALRYIT
uniref:Cytochrome b n=1 Tax=Brugia timori TaxID=42155 RepID=A0A0R3QDC7_9BILA